MPALLPAARRHLGPVLDTLKWLKHESSVWLEITNLIIPIENDNPDDVRCMCEWIVKELGDEVPLYFSAFHPDFRLRNRPHTPAETLIYCRNIALRAGLKYVYTGNVSDVERQSTYCPGCKKLLIERDWYELGEYHLQANACAYCGHVIAGHFAEAPGTWGRCRFPVNVTATTETRGVR